MIAPPRLALMTMSRLDQLLRSLRRVLEVSEKSRLSMDTKKVVFELVSMQPVTYVCSTHHHRLLLQPIQPHLYNSKQGLLHCIIRSSR